MFTLLLAWINAKYKFDYELLFLGAFILDATLINNVCAIFIKYVIYKIN